MEEQGIDAIVRLVDKKCYEGFGERETVELQVGTDYEVLSMTIGEGLVLRAVEQKSGDAATDEQDDGQKPASLWVTSEIFSLEVSGERLVVITDFSIFEFEFRNHVEREGSQE